MSLPAILAITTETIDKSLMHLSPKYKASRFYADRRRFHVRDDHEFNAWVRDDLLREYGYKE